MTSRQAITIVVVLVLAFVFSSITAQTPTPSATPTPATYNVPGGRVRVPQAMIQAAVTAYLQAHPPAAAQRIPLGTPTAATPGADGDTMIDTNYIYTFYNGSWKRSIRANLD